MTDSSKSRRKKKRNPLDPQVAPHFDLPSINNPNDPNVVRPNLAGDVRKSMFASKPPTPQDPNGIYGGRWELTPSGAIWVKNTADDQGSPTAYGKKKGTPPTSAPDLIDALWGGTNRPDETKRGTGDQVYMGIIADEAGDHSGPRSQVDRVITLDQAKDDVYSWSEHRLFALGKQLAKAGLINDPQDRSGIYQVWQGATVLAGKYYAAGKKLTPWDVLQLKGFNVAGAGSGSGRSPYANKTLTENHRDTNYIDDATADAYTHAIFQETIGRDPTADELSKYRILVAGYEKKHPSITKATVHYNDMGVADNTDTTVIQGPDAVGLQQRMKDQSKQDPEYGAYQAATTYYNGLWELINGR